MKNVYPRLLTILSVLLIGCGTIWAERVSQDDAAQVASNFMNAGDGSSQAAQAPGRRVQVRKVAQAQEAQYYVYENADGEGWVMVAANDVVQPILAYSETGKFNADEQPKNVARWLRGYNNQIKFAEENNVEATEEVKAKWKTLRKAPPVTAKGTVVVGPLITTTWDQDDPYWQYCPSVGSTKTLVGCVATAMAQVMNYWQWPEKGTGSYSYTSETKSLSCSANFGNTTYDWANMVDHYTNYYTGTTTHSVSTPTTAQKEAVATLMYHCGVAAEMDYNVSSAGGSGTQTIYPNASMTSSRCAAYALINNFGYKKSTLKCYYRPGGYGYTAVSDANWLKLLKDELNAMRPIMYAGADSEGGHSFVCDGYDDQNYFHFNWGWSGYCDGYYTVDNMVPGTGGSGAGNGSYNDDQDIIIGIIPDKPNITITWSVGGVTSTTTQSAGKLVLPTTTPSDCSGSGGKKFVGWTANSSISNGAKPSDLFSTVTTQTVTAATTYYAVYATESGSGGTPSSASYTFTSKAWAATEGDWTSGKDGNGFDTSKNGIQVTTGATGANGTCPTSYNEVTSVVLSYCTNASKGKGTITVTIGSTSVEQSITPVGTTATTKEFDFSGTTPTGAPQISVACTENSIYICGATINYGGGASYSDYSLKCGTPCSNTPTMSFASATVSKTTADASFTKAVTISGKGSGQTVAYSSSDETIATVNASGVVTLKGKVGSTTITASVEASGTYCSASASYTLNVTAAPINVTLYYGGTSATLSNQTNPFTLPTTGTYVADMCDGDWTFDGWYGSTYAKSETKPDYITELTATGSAYAVYKTTETVAAVSPRKATSSASYSFSNKSWQSEDGNWTSGKDGAGYSNNGVQVTKNATGANATCPNSYDNISSIVVSYCTNASSGAGTIVMEVDGTEVSQSVTSSGGTTARNLEFDFSSTKPNGNPKITVNCTTNSIYVCGVTINYGGGTTTTTYYATTPECATPVEPCALTSITLNTDNGTKNFTTGDTFSSSGLVVTANYSNCESKTVTPTGISSPDMSSAGQKTVTVTYTENGTTKTATYTITVSAPVTFTVTWSVDGATTPVVFNDGAALVLPTAPSDCEGGKKFMGWTAQSSVDGSAPADLFTTASGTITANATYYAVFATSRTSGGGASNDYTLYNGALTEGDYLIVYSGAAMKASISSSRLAYEEVTATNDVITTTDASIIWHIAASDDYWTIYNAGESKYAASTGTKNQAQLLESGTDNKSLWTCSSSAQSEVYDFVNKANTASNINAILRKNGTYGFACYASGTGGTLSLYKNTSSGGGGETTYSDYSLNCTDVTTYTVTWKACGEVFATQTFAEGAALVLPTSTPADNAGKQFYGWTTTEHYTGASAPPDVFTSAGSKTVTADVTYYAIYK